MIVFRFAPALYKDDLSGEGARKFGGRWNSMGLPVVYTSLNISLALLELLIHHASYDEIRQNYLTIMEVPEQVTEINAGQLKNNWMNDESYTRFMGDEFLYTKTSLLLKVPSAIIPPESNILINPLHPDFKKIKITSAEAFAFDNRLFK